MSDQSRISRGLTVGEVDMATVIFKSSINYAVVRIHNKKYIFFQPKTTLMTPNGNIFAAKAYKEDYSKAGPLWDSLFIHEMVHVWQLQNGVLNPKWHAIGEFFSNWFNYNKAYYYTLDGNKDLKDYRIEQQAQIVQDYYRIFHQNLGPLSDYLRNNVSEAERNKLYKQVLAKFLVNPGYPRQKSAALGASGLQEGYSGGGWTGGGSSSW